MLQRQRGGVARVNIRKWAIIGVLLVVTLAGLLKIQSSRSDDAREKDTVAEAILLKDYYAPFHILIAAMALEYVYSWEVAVSNSANSLFLLNHPYLQATVADLFNPGVSTRSTGYAFYIFSEGYLVMGWLGFLYNGLVVFAGMALWRLLGNGNNALYNAFDDRAWLPRSCADRTQPDLLLLQGRVHVLLPGHAPRGDWAAAIPGRGLVEGIERRRELKV